MKLPEWKQDNWILLLLVVLALFLARKLQRINTIKHLSKKWGTKPIKSISISLKERILEVRKLSSSGKFFDNYKSRFDQEKTHTLQTSFLGNTVVLTMSPQNVKWILGKHVEDWNLGSRPTAFGPLLGKGIFVAEGERWKHLREMLKPQFMREQISHVSMLEPHVKVLKELILMRKGKSFDIQRLFHRLTMDASTEFLFGESVSSLKFELPYGNIDEEDLKRKIEFDQSLLYVQEYLFFRVLFFEYYWFFNSSKFRSAVANVHDFAMRTVEKTLKLRANSAPSQKGELHYVFLDELMKETSDPRTMRDESLNIMLAGRSTTASLLLSVFYELSRNPSVWQKLKEEVVKTFGTGEFKEDLRSITFENLKRCIYLRYVINETLRLYPPVALNLRKAVRDTYLPQGGGPNGEDPCFINKGDYVALHIYSMHRLEEIFGLDAASFNPERWESLSTKVGSGFIPFGTGPRVCLGQQYALTEASYVTVRLVQMFSAISSFNSCEYPPPKRITATLQFSEGVNISMT